MAIITTTTEEPTGALAATLPVILPSAGVNSYANRWIASRLTAADGASVVSWPAAFGSKVLANDLGTAPVVGLVGGKRVVKFSAGSLSAFGTPGKTIVAVVRATAAAGILSRLVSLGLPTLSRNASNNASAFASPASLNTLPMPTNAWTVLVWTLDGANMTLRVNGAETSATTAANAADQINLGRAQAEFGLVDFAEVIEYAAVLDATQRAAVYAALKANYPELAIA